MIDIGKTVKLYDFAENEEVCYKIVSTSYKYRYVGRDFDSYDYQYQVEQVLSEGGNGLDSISLESELGSALYGKDVGDIVQFTNRMGETEKFKVLAIR